MRIWRIVTGSHAVWSGEGARIWGGRWNPAGVPAIYGATSFSGAIVEVLVHANTGRMPANARYVVADVPADVVVEALDSAALPGWQDAEPDASRAAGAAWLRSARSAVLLVPSVVSAGLDSNAVVNPLHPDAARITVSAEQPVRWDGRLFWPSRS